MENAGSNLDGSIKALNRDEKKQIEKVGFIVKRLISPYQYFITLFSHSAFYLFLSIFPYIFIMIVLSSFQNISIQTINTVSDFFMFGYWYILFPGFLLLVLYITYKYSIFQRVMISSKRKVMVNNTIYEDISDIPIRILQRSLRINQVWWDLVDWAKTPPKMQISDFFGRNNLRMFVSYVVIWLLFWLLTGTIFLISILLFIVWLMIVYVSDNILTFNRFTFIGLKIQNLTISIHEQSQLIQSEFEKDMNFSVLHSGFEKLSRTFSSIVELVLKLEKIEARANKGDLFDSAKYIGSLRADIVTPLTELKKFLESQRKQLLESQRELSRVRVGWPDTSANIELQSKRSESILQELDTNIAKLGEMITKIW